MRLRLGERDVDLERRAVSSPRGSLALTEREAALLGVLAAQAGRTVSRDELLAEVWDDVPDAQPRTVDQAVRRLRTKIEPRPVDPVHLITVHGMGYRLELGPAKVAPRTNLAPDRSPLVGRQAELDALGALADPLVTVVGPAGAGKTRLARAFAARWVEQSGDAWFVDASPARSLDDLCNAVAAVLDVPLAGADDPVGRIGAALAGRGALLLVLDNLEQLLTDAPRAVDPWRAAAPASRLLVTSRERLRLDGERVFPLAPLEEVDAVRLLLERAARVRPGWGADDPGSVRAVAQRLEGLPLALELAAARATTLNPRELLERLDDRLGTLTVGPRSATARQATLSGALDWSWDLLGPAEREVFALTGVFRGGFTLRLLEGVLGRPALDAVQSLVDHSLLRAAPTAEGTRYLPWEHVREYARARLEADGRWDDAVLRHRSAVLALTEPLASALFGRDGLALLGRLEAERDNLLAVADRARDRDADATVRVARALDPLLVLRGPSGTHRRLLDEALAVAAVAGTDDVRAALLVARSDLRRKGGDRAGAGRDLDEAQPLAAEPTTVARVALSMSILRLETGRIPDAEAEARRAGELARAAGDRHTEGVALCFQGAALEAAGRVAEADAALAAALAILEDLGDRAWIGNALAFRGAVALGLGDTDRARAGFEQAIAINREVRSPRREAVLWTNLGNLHLAEDRAEDAIDAYSHAIALQQAVGMGREAAVTLQNLSMALLDTGDLDGAEDALHGALAACQGAGRNEAIAAGTLGIVDLLRGRSEVAAGRLSSAAAALTAGGDPRSAAYFSVWRAAAAADRDALFTPDDPSARPLAEVLAAVATGVVPAHDGRAVEVRIAARWVAAVLAARPSHL